VPSVSNYLDALVTMNTPIKQVKVFDLKQSMQNGGGPACLRLRVALKENELKAINSGVLLTDSLYDALVGWVERHYRDRVSPEDLADPSLLVESRTALDELTRILHLGDIYPFQCA
jgi:succinylarginine dihydrolase